MTQMTRKNPLWRRQGDKQRLRIVPAALQANALLTQ
jgi:hypothetical protein